MVANTIVSFWAPAHFQWRTVSFRECKLPIEHHGSGVKKLIEDASQHDLPLIFRNSKLDFVPRFSSEKLSRCVFLCRSFPHKDSTLVVAPSQATLPPLLRVLYCVVANPKPNLHFPRLHPGCWPHLNCIQYPVRITEASPAIASKMYSMFFFEQR